MMPLHSYVRRMAILAWPLLAAGCAVGPDFRHPDLARDYPSPDALAAPVRDLRADWWSGFGNAQLDARVARSLRNNPDVQAAQAALMAARETAEAQRGSFFPAVSAEVNPTRQKTSGALSSVPADGSYVYSLHTASLTMAYTPDLFGGNRRSVEALVSQADAQEAQWQATRLTLIANVAVGFIQEAGLAAQLQAVDAAVQTQQHSLEIVQKRLALGDASRGDVLLQTAALAAVQAQRPALEKQLAQQRDRNAVLEGLGAAAPDADPATLASIRMPADLPASVPSAWLEDRPDIRMAEAQWHAARAQVGVATAMRLPSLTLTAGGGSSAASFGSLFGPGTAFWNLAGDLAAPIFDGGALRHRQRAAEATDRQAAATYRSTVINAFANVADALHAREADERGYQLALAARDAAAQSYQVAQAQSADGDISTLTLLAAEQTLRNADLTLASAQMQRLEDAVALLQAITPR
ncbi:efflux transporter outer membrane subunit [Luteibacter sp. 9135]|uniref:efflux transporter outer membrane subunit n=1 Tax=Luteibacter sp. 9135 TaxID=1500893 RepID=UPI00068FCD61|nr:efflux transporter outer membrane subunit [Luteibacter sp. 9135]